MRSTGDVLLEFCEIFSTGNVTFSVATLSEVTAAAYFFLSAFFLITH